LAPVRVLVNPVTAFLGRISYSIYLVHWFVLAHVSIAAYTVGFPEPVRWAAYIVVIFVLTTALATLTYYLIEAPFMKLGAYIIRGRANARRRHASTGDLAGPAAARPAWRSAA
jgi:peptidoglycan/LPS O-acetylase OafA/YrhL